MGDPRSLGEMIAEMQARQAVERPCASCGAPARSPLVRVICPACYSAELARQWASAARDVERDLLRTIPARYRDAELAGDGLSRLTARVSGDRIPEQAQAAIVSRRNVVVRGLSGSGKTTVAVAMLRELCMGILREAREVDEREYTIGTSYAWSRARSCTYLRSHDVTNACDARRLGEADPPELEAAEGAAVLLLDDLALEPPHNKIAEILLRRGDAERTTIVTTTATDDQLIARYGEGAIRRLIEAGSGVVIHCGRAA